MMRPMMRPMRNTPHSRGRDDCLPHSLVVERNIPALAGEKCRVRVIERATEDERPLPHERLPVPRR